MKVLVIGSGAREHAIVSSFLRSSCEPEVICAPGNAGIALETRTENLSAGSVEDIEKLVEFVRSEGVDLTVVGPEAPLVLGIVERFEADGLKVLGPGKVAAQLEGSKCFSKEFLARHSIPTADFRIFDAAGAARAYVEKGSGPIVLKADGLAAGKGVIVAADRKEALKAVDAILVERRFGDAGDRMIVEECLVGSEISFFIISDGDSYVSLETAQDYKPALDGDHGPNTGGMGSYSPYYSLTDSVIEEIKDVIVDRTMRGLKEDGIVYRGVLYIGIMLTESGPSVLEFNVRLGDPEAEVLLPRLRTDMVELSERVLNGQLAGYELSWDPRDAVTVVAASPGYPASYPKGLEITGLETVKDPDVKVFHAGTKLTDGKIVTSGGRVLTVTALGNGRKEAREKAYAALSGIRFDGMHSRTDIAAEGR